jgi:hypothetical protein
MLPNEVYVPNPQFNVAPFGKVINLTFNQTFLRELTNVLNLKRLMPSVTRVVSMVSSNMVERLLRCLSPILLWIYQQR